MIFLSLLAAKLLPNMLGLVKSFPVTKHRTRVQTILDKKLCPLKVRNIFIKLSFINSISLKSLLIRVDLLAGTRPVATRPVARVLPHCEHRTSTATLGSELKN